MQELLSKRFLENVLDKIPKFAFEILFILYFFDKVTFLNFAAMYILSIFFILFRQIFMLLSQTSILPLLRYQT